MRSFFNSRLFLIILSLVLVLAIFIASLPSLLSTSWGKKQVTAWIGRSIPGQVEIEKLNLNWTSGQTIEGLALRDKQGKLIVEFENFSTDATLWQILRKSTQLGHTQIKDLNGVIVTDEKGISNLQYALGLATENSSATIPPSTIRLSHFNANLHLFTKGQPLSFKLSGETTQEHVNGSFLIEALFPEMETGNWSQIGEEAQKLLSIEGGKEVTLAAQITNFPVDLIDRIVALQNSQLNGIFRSFLGEKINITLDKKPSSEALLFNLNILSNNMKGQLVGKINSKEMTIESPATFQIDLLPNSINPYIQKHFTFVDPTQIKIVLENLNIPLNFFSEEGTSSCPFGLIARGELQNQPRLSVSSVGEIQMTGFNIHLDTPLCAKTVEVQVEGEAQQLAQKPFTWVFKSTLNKPSGIKKLFSEIQNNSTASLKLIQVPTSLIFSAAGKESDKFQNFIGSAANMSLQAQQIEPAHFHLLASLQTDYLTVEQAELKIGSSLQTLKPIQLKYVPNLDFLNSLIASQPLSIEEVSPLAITVQNLDIPLQDKTKGKIESEISIPSLKIGHKNTSRSLQFNHLKIKNGGSLFQDQKIELTSHLDLLDTNQSPLLLLGKNAQLKASSLFSLDPAGNPLFKDLNAYLDSDTINLVFLGDFLPNKLVMTKPLQIHYKLQPQILEDLNIQSKEQFPKLQNTPMLRFKIEPFQLNLKEVLLKNIVFKGSLETDSLLVQSTSETVVKLENIDIPWEINSPLNVTRINFKGQVSSKHQEKKGKLAVQLLISNWLKEGALDPSDLKVEAISNMIGLPTSLVSLLILNKDLTPILGSILDLELQALIDRNQATPGYWDMVLDSPHLHIKSRLMYGDAITLYETTSKSSVDIRWTLTPEGYEFLSQLLQTNPSIKLSSPVTFKTYFTDLHIPLKNQTSFFDKAKFSINLESSDIVWNDTSIPTFKIKGLVHSPNITERMDVNLHTFSKNSAQFSFIGYVENLFDAKGQMNWNEAHLKAELQTNKIPVSLFKAFSLIDGSQQSKINALIGSELDTQIHFDLNKMEGPLEAYVEGAKGNISLDGKLKQGILTLQKPFQWNILFTPELSQLFINQNMPLLSSALGTEEPIQIVIDKKGTSIPLIPFDFSNITIPNGTLRLGKVLFRNEGELKNILNILKPIPENQIIIWFTPIYFQLAKNSLVIKRADLLVADRYSLAAWGNLNLTTHKMHFTIGLTEQALRNALGIKGLDPDYVLQIPVKGKDGSVEIDKAKALARISVLMAQSQVDSKIKILGNVLDIATSGLEGTQTPKPTTDPLPWQNKIDENRSVPNVDKNENNKSNRSQENGGKDQLIKELEKGASKILDFLK